MPQMLNQPTYNEFIRPDAAAFGNQQINPFIQFVKQATAHDDYIRAIQAKEAEGRNALMEKLFGQDIYTPAEVSGIVGATPRVNPYQNIWDSFIGNAPTYTQQGKMPAESIVNPNFLNPIMKAAGIAPTNMTNRSLKLFKDLIKQGMVSKTAKDVANINASNKGNGGSKKGDFAPGSPEDKLYTRLYTEANKTDGKGNVVGLNSDLIKATNGFAKKYGISASAVISKVSKDLANKGKPDVQNIQDLLNELKYRDMSGSSNIPYIAE